MTDRGEFGDNRPLAGALPDGYNPNRMTDAFEETESGVCALPTRYAAGAASNPRLVASAQALADALIGSDEYQTFARLAKEVKQDRAVAELTRQIRQHHSLYNKAQNGALVAQLEALPLMSAYRKAEEELRLLCAEVDRMIGAQAGLPFSQHVRPQGHG